MRLLQVCNVGNIVGGTAACAWSLTRALPDVAHHVAFLSDITPETRRVFGSATLHRWTHVRNRDVRALGVDAVILHNVSGHRAERIEAAWTLQYVHSAGRRAPADRTVYCSRWLAEQCGHPDGEVLYQGVPGMVRRHSVDQTFCLVGTDETSVPQNRLVVGRLCTPTARKWPAALIPFYETLASAHPKIDWEFVGCPQTMVSALRTACQNRATFHPAGWNARRHLARWNALLYHHPTLTESFGRTAAEAMRSGCLPIVDARGGFLEQIVPGTGWLCATEADFSDALAQITNRGAGVSDFVRERGDSLFSLAAFRKRLRKLLRTGFTTD
jgi:hypothetical protein